MYIIMNPNGTNGSFTSATLLKRRVKGGEKLYCYFQLAASSILCNNLSADLRCFDCCLNAELGCKCGVDGHMALSAWHVFFLLMKQESLFTIELLISGIYISEEYLSVRVQRYLLFKGFLHQTDRSLYSWGGFFFLPYSSLLNYLLFINKIIIMSHMKHPCPPN